MAFLLLSVSGIWLIVDSPKADQRQDDLRKPWLGREVTRGRMVQSHTVCQGLSGHCRTCLEWPQEKRRSCLCSCPPVTDSQHGHSLLTHDIAQAGPVSTAGWKEVYTGALALQGTQQLKPHVCDLWPPGTQLYPVSYKEAAFDEWPVLRSLRVGWWVRPSNFSL